MRRPTELELPPDWRKIKSGPVSWATTAKKTDPLELRVATVWELMARLKLRLEDLTYANS